MLRDDSERVACGTPAKGKKPVRILKWKFEAVRKAILKVVPRSKSGAKSIFFKDLCDEVRGVMKEEDLEDLGSLGWYTTTVKLEMEVRGEIRRVEERGPQRLAR